MTIFRTALLGALALAISPCFGQSKAIRYAVQPNVSYAPEFSANPATKCSWTEKLTTKLAASGAKAPDDDAVNPGYTPTVRLSVVKFLVPEAGSYRKLETRIRVDVLAEEQLVATRDLAGKKRAAPATSNCDALHGLIGDYADEIDNWVSDTQFPTCVAGCQGIHPEEPIVTAALVAEETPEALNDVVRKDCGWSAYLPQLVADAFNDEDDPAPRAPLTVKSGHQHGDTTRTLVLTASNVHVLGSGFGSGPKGITLKGELRDGAMLAGSFTIFQRERLGGVSNCTQLKSMTESITDKIADWLRRPELGSEL